MAGVLSFSDYLGGPDNLQCIQTFPSTQKIFTYDFGTTASSYLFALDYQTLVVDPVTFDRNTGEPNFANSQIIGYFPKVDLHGGVGTGLVAAGASFAPAVDGNGQAAAGTYVRTNGTTKVDVLYPAYMYKGPIVPDARSKVCITVVGFSWANGATANVAAIETHRFAFIQNYEPDVTVGDPTTSTNPLYTALTLA